VTAVPGYAGRVRSRRSRAHCLVAPGRAGWTPLPAGNVLPVRHSRARRRPARGL